MSHPERMSNANVVYIFMCKSFRIQSYEEHESLFISLSTDMSAKKKGILTFNFDNFNFYQARNLHFRNAFRGATFSRIFGFGDMIYR